MPKTDINFDLIIENWIPVIGLDGTPQLVSLRDVLIGAHRIRGISASLPHSNAAIKRLLLAVLFRNFGPIDDRVWDRLWKNGHFDANILDRYFSDYGKYFDLFSKERPFFQARDHRVEEQPAQALLQMIGGGDTFTLFDHVMDETQFSLAPPDAALLLLTAQSFGLAGIRHPQLNMFYTDAPCSRAAVFFVEGKNLFETLMYNLIRYSRAEPFPWNREVPDRPVWEAEDPYLPERFIPLGYMDFLTWPNRRIILIPEEKNGDTVVSRITSEPGLILAPEVRNPMYHYRKVAGRGAEADSLKMLRFTEGRALWRDSYALLNIDGDKDEPPRAIGWVRNLIDDGFLPEHRLQLAAYGMSTEPGKAKVNFYRSERFEIDDVLLRDPSLIDKLGTALDDAENMRNELHFTLSHLAAAMLVNDIDKQNGRKPNPADMQNLMNHWDAEAIYWGALNTPFDIFLNDLPTDPEKALHAWREELFKSVHRAFWQTADGLGNSQEAFKAVASTKGWLNYGIRKVLGNFQKE